MKFTSVALSILFFGGQSTAFLASRPHTALLHRSSFDGNDAFVLKSRLHYRNETSIASSEGVKEEIVTDDSTHSDLGLEYSPIFMFGKGRVGDVAGDKNLLGGKGANLAEMVRAFI